MISAFGIDHGPENEIEKAFNPFKGGVAAGRRVGESTPMFDKLAAKHGVTMGGARKAPGARKGSYKVKSFLPFGRGGKRRA
jgi:hypothetical protein